MRVPGLQLIQQGIGLFQGVLRCRIKHTKIIKLVHKIVTSLLISTIICLSVRGRSLEAIRPELNRSLLCKAAAGSYIKESTDTASKGASSRLKEALLQSVHVEQK